MFLNTLKMYVPSFYFGFIQPIDWLYLLLQLLYLLYLYCGADDS